MTGPWPLARRVGCESSRSIYEPESGIRRIVAHIVPNIAVERRPELVAELRATATHRLLPTMLPADYVFLDGLPVSVNGELDRKALPAPRRTTVPENRAPRTAQEARLSELFARVLEIDHIGIDESFFELGGHSLLAARLVRMIQEELDIDLAIGAIFQAPTIAGSPELIRLGLGNGRDALDVLLPIRGEGDETPIFFVHPGVGLSWCYFGFSSHLRGMPLYGLQSRAITGLDRMAGSVSEMAGDYLDQVRKIQQTGPYRLVGWSFGGNVAHAMAGLLGEADEEVELLAVIDVCRNGAAEVRSGPAGQQWSRTSNTTRISLPHNMIR